MPEITKAVIESILSGYTLPYLDQDPVSSNAVRAITIKADLIKVELELGIPVAGIQHQICEEINDLLKHQTTASDILVNVSSRIVSHAVQKNVSALPGIKNVIAVGSGKGGVGKSTVSVNLALALAEEGARVGIMDADIYGPSIPTMLGCHGRAESKDGKSFEPVESYGLQCISMGHMLDTDDAPVIWRGPMATSALQQLIKEAKWRDLDYLVIDLPPGTGDIQLTLCQNIPLTGAVIVTTPQDIALVDAQKALKMFEKVSVSVLGVIENMSTHVCSHCGHVETIFGTGGGKKMTERYGIPLLGELPLDIRIREDVDSGEPTVASDPESPISACFIEIARKVTSSIAMKPKDYSGKIPKIVVEKNRVN